MPFTEIDSIRCPVFRDMTTHERRTVIGLLESEAYPAGDVILREGKSIQCLWIIAEGRCEVLKRMKNGTEQCLALLEPFTVFGEMSFFNPGPHSASVRARTEVEVLRLTRSRYDRLEQTCPTAAHKIAYNTVHVLVERLRRMDDWIRDLVERPEAARHREEWREFQARLYSDWQF